MSEYEILHRALPECQRVCRAKLELEQEKIKSYSLKMDLEKYKQDMSSMLRQLSIVFATNLYVDKMSNLTQVESVYIVKKEDLLDIWTFITKSDLDVEEKIADAQCELMRVHRELDFDFMIVPLFGRKTDLLLPPEAKQIYSKS